MNDSEKIDLEASEWFAAMHDATLSMAETRDFNQWLAQSSLHRQSYLDYVQLWHDLSALPSEAFDRPCSPSLVDSSGAQLKNTRQFHTHCKNIPVRSASDPASDGMKLKSMLSFRLGIRLRTLIDRFNSWQLASMVVSVCCLIAIGLGSMFTEHSESIAPPQFHQTAVAELRTLVLDDGSEVTLSGNSKIEARISEHRREVTLLRGQAFFDVVSRYDTSGNKTSFFVTTNNTHIDVLGTQFDVNLLDTKTLVTVAEGAVQVSIHRVDLENAPAMMLKPGEKVAVIGRVHSTLERMENVNAKDASTWRVGRLTYSNASLSDIVQELNRFHSAEIRLSESSLNELRITAAFRTDQLDGMISMLEKIIPVAVETDVNNNVVIKPRL